MLKGIWLYYDYFAYFFDSTLAIGSFGSYFLGLGFSATIYFLTYTLSPSNAEISLLGDLY